MLDSGIESGNEADENDKVNEQDREEAVEMSGTTRNGVGYNFWLTVWKCEKSDKNREQTQGKTEKAGATRSVGRFWDGHDFILTK